MGLQRELFGAAAGGRGRGGQPPRKDRRKAERDAKRGRGGGGRGGGSGRPQWQHQQQPRRGADLRKEAPSSDDDEQQQQQQRAGKRQRVDEAGRGLRAGAGAGADGSRFAELLPAALQEGRGLDPERALQRDLVRKLGLKRGDGIDLGGIDDVLEEESEPEAAAAAAASGGGKRKAAEAAAEAWRAGASDGSGESGDEKGGSEVEQGMSDGEGEEGASELEVGWSEEDEESDSESDSDEEEEGEEGSNARRRRPQQQRRGGGEGSEDEEGGGEEQGSGEEEEEELSDLELLHGGGSSSSTEEEESESDEDEEAGSGSEDEGRQRGPANGAAAAATAAAPGRYVPPAARRTAAAAAADGEDEERVARRVRGLLNRIAESNLQGIVGQLAELYQEERRAVSDAVCAELLAAAAEGPRASEAFAAVAAAAVGGLAAAVGAPEVVANFVDRMGARIEAAVAAGDSLRRAGRLRGPLAGAERLSLARRVPCHNLGLLAAQLYLCGAIKADLAFSMLHAWRARLGEADVGLLSAALRRAGLALRTEDPQAMRDFVVALQARAAEAGAAGGLSKRAQMMLELVVDIKNNRRARICTCRMKHEGGGAGAGAALPPAVTKWLRSSGVRDVALGGIPWAKVLQPGKRGIWWRPEAADVLPERRGAGGALAAAAAAAAAGGADAEGGLSAPELLELAAAQRMNTEARREQGRGGGLQEGAGDGARAVFCILVGSSDCVDAFEKLLRLDLKGEQEREVVRVCVEVALQEAGYNPYYALLLLRLCAASKAHRVTLQYCLWDHLKQLPGMETRRLTHLARLAAAVVAGRGLPAASLKGADWAAGGAGMAPRQLLFWRVFFQHLLAGCKSGEDAAAIFARLAAQPALGTLRSSLRAFLQRSVGPWLAAMTPAGAADSGKASGRAGGKAGTGLSEQEVTTLLRRLRAVERELGGGTGGGA
eukprot:scaffold1.g5712.t1